jgi:uncharacterized membrane protein
MSKILELNGYKYSREQFEGYKFRITFRIGVDTNWRNDSLITIYTDNPNKEEVNDVIISRTTDKVKSFIMECWTTKEQDDLAIQFIEETLKDL